LSDTGDHCSFVSVAVFYYEKEKRQLFIGRDYVQVPAEHWPLQHTAAVPHGQPGGQHSAKGGTPQFGLHDAAEAGLGVPMVVISGSAMTIAWPSLSPSWRLEMRGRITSLD
jgi:hypothetical protein